MTPETIKIPDSCEECEKFLYKGDDEMYCLAARTREIFKKRWMKKPKWCPIERRYRIVAEYREKKT